MRSRHLILTLVDACSGRPEFGRTALQQMTYFAAQVLGVDQGHRAHYYGPFSDLVEEDVASLVLGGLVQEDMTLLGHGAGGRGRKYRYTVTQEGHKRLQLVQQRYPHESAHVRDVVERVLDVAGSLEQDLLSQAAKTFFVAHETGEVVGFEELQQVAGESGWKLVESEREPVERLLEALARG